jgi:hypothetical protein
MRRWVEQFNGTEPLPPRPFCSGYDFRKGQAIANAERSKAAGEHMAIAGIPERSIFAAPHGAMNRHYLRGSQERDKT